MEWEILFAPTQLSHKLFVKVVRLEDGQQLDDISPKE